LAALDQTAKKYNSTPAKVSLAWLLTRPTITAPIASATNVAQLRELVDATNLNLDRESVQLLDQASAPSFSAAT
jgi:aryl-alcohol dehydrogenase-like predicted oxidoreductase